MSRPSRPAIQLRGVRVHNLKDVDLDLPLGRLIVLTGVSGSGKSSLAFDTLYAEGQRRYIETFSPYTRQFLDMLGKPDADSITGIPPAIAVSQKLSRRSPRSTVGTVTEIHEYLAILYGRQGRVVCPSCQREVRPASARDVVAAIERLEPGTRYQIAFPVVINADTAIEALVASLREDGFVRARAEGAVRLLDEPDWSGSASGSIDVIVDRLVRGSEDPGRRMDSIETALNRGQGRAIIITDEHDELFVRGWRCGGCNADFQAPEPRLFRYNNPLGACPACEGFGRIVDLDLDRIVPDPGRTLAEGAIVPWTTPAYRPWLDQLLTAAPGLGIPVDRPFKFLERAQVQRLLDGGPGLGGLREFFRVLERKAYKMHIRVFLSRWRGYQPCPVCGGARLRPEALAVRFNGRNLAELCALPIHEALQALEPAASPSGDPTACRILEQVRDRLGYLVSIGLGYLTLDRQARTLSAGESRRVALTTALGSGLVNTLYVLDEPSIGLHPGDVPSLVGSIQRLRDRGNTVVVVEHEASLIRAADQVVDIGPGAGDAGGRVLFQGTPAAMARSADSITGPYLNGAAMVRLPATRRTPSTGWVELRGASGNNLKNVDASFPLGVFCVVSGVSGAGKSTLVEETLYPALMRRVKGEPMMAGPHRELRGTQGIDDVVLVDQSPIGRTPRSNPVTYVKAFDEIRRTFSLMHEAKLRNYAPSTFSFNVEGGRCSTCEGNGYQLVDMQFLPDVLIRCPECQGTRYRPEVLEVTYRGKNIAEVLDLTVRAAFPYFRHRPKVQARLRPLIDVGLDYLRLGQPASTLSGGEAQRLKLASHLGGSAASIARVASSPRTLFLLDEPTTGLHPADVETLLDALNRLVDLGHSLIVVEHDVDVMASADWLIDLGPGAGAAGGQIMAAGTPEEIASGDSPTGRALASALKARDR